MDQYRYHHYLFFDMKPTYHRFEAAKPKQKADFQAELENQVKHRQLKLTSYATLGFKAHSTFMLWLRGPDPAAVTNMLPSLLNTGLGQSLDLHRVYFGLVLPSQYSGRTGKPEQDMNQFDDRLPFLALYPFTKTHEWYQLSSENRHSVMGQHIKTGVSHPEIRQCLVHSTGLGDQEFIVSYEMKNLEEFHQLVVQMRSTIGRPYTLSDMPIHVGIHKPLDQLMDWL